LITRSKPIAARASPLRIAAVTVSLIAKNRGFLDSKPEVRRAS